MNVYNVDKSKDKAVPTMKTWKYIIGSTPYTDDNVFYQYWNDTDTYE